MSKHLAEIDDFDLGRIANKINDLEQIIKWLEQLKKLDPSTDNVRMKEVIASLKEKLNRFRKKFKTGYEEMVEYGDIVSKMYDGD